MSSAINQFAIFWTARCFAFYYVLYGSAKNGSESYRTREARLCGTLKLILRPHLMPCCKACRKVCYHIILEIILVLFVLVLFCSTLATKCQICSLALPLSIPFRSRVMRHLTTQPWGEGSSTNWSRLSSIVSRIPIPCCSSSLAFVSLLLPPSAFDNFPSVPSPAKRAFKHEKKIVFYM